MNYDQCNLSYKKNIVFYPERPNIHKYLGLECFCGKTFLISVFSTWHTIRHLRTKGLPTFLMHAFMS